MIIVDDAKGLPADDRGLGYGDGVFRSMLVWARTVNDLDGQLDHLCADALRIGIEGVDRHALRAACQAQARRHDRGVLRATITRGSGGRGYAPDADATPRAILRFAELPSRPRSWWQRGVVVRDADLRLARQPRLAGIKHLNRLEQVLASLEPRPRGTAESVLCDQTGWIVGGIMSNLFWLHEDTLHTPPLTNCGVAGRMRARILALAPELGLDVRQTRKRPGDCRSQAQAVLLCNSVIGIWSVRRWQTTEFSGAASSELVTMLRRALAHPWQGGAAC